MKDNRELLRPYLADMSAVVTHIQEAVDRQCKDDDIAKVPQALNFLNQLDTVLRRQMQQLNGQLESFPGGGVSGAVKNTVTGVMGMFAGLYDKVRAETASRALRDDYTALNLAAISYTMLHTSALALGENTTADLALKNLKELTPLIMQLVEVVPQAVVSELAAEGKTSDVLQRAIREAQEAWAVPTPAHA